MRTPPPVEAVGATWETKVDPEETQRLLAVEVDWKSGIRRMGLGPTVLEIGSGVTEEEAVTPRGS